MDGKTALKVLAEARTSDVYSRNVADQRDDLPDTHMISILVPLGVIRESRKALGIPKRDRGLNE